MISGSGDDEIHDLCVSLTTQKSSSPIKRTQVRRTRSVSNCSRPFLVHSGLCPLNLCPGGAKCRRRLLPIRPVGGSSWGEAPKDATFLAVGICKSSMDGPAGCTGLPGLASGAPARFVPLALGGGGGGLLAGPPPASSALRFPDTCCC